jgi:hypothetical protein
VEMREVATRELMEARDALEASQRAEGAAREAAADARRAAQEAAQQRGAATTTSEVHAEAVMELVDARETAARSLALAKALLLGHDLDPSERFDAARDPLAWMKQDPVEEDGVPDEESGCHLLCSRALTDMTSFHLSAKAFVTDITMCIPEDFEARDAVVLRQAVAAVLDARHNHEVALRLEACSLAEHLAVPALAPPGPRVAPAPPPRPRKAWSWGLSCAHDRHTSSSRANSTRGGASPPRQGPPCPARRDSTALAAARGGGGRSGCQCLRPGDVVGVRPRFGGRRALCNEACLCVSMLDSRVPQRAAQGSRKKPPRDRSVYWTRWAWPLARMQRFR